MMGRKPDDVGSLFMSVHVNRVAWSSAARSVEYDIPIVAPSYLRALIPRLLNDLVVSLEHKNTLLGQKGDSQDHLASPSCPSRLSSGEMWFAFLLKSADTFQVIGTLVDGLTQGFDVFKDSGGNRVGFRQDAQLFFDDSQDEWGLGGDALGKLIGERF